MWHRALWLLWVFYLFVQNEITQHLYFSVFSGHVAPITIVFVSFYGIDCPVLCKVFMQWWNTSLSKWKGEPQIIEHCFGVLPLGNVVSEMQVNFFSLHENGVNCAALKVWISLGPAPLTAWESRRMRKIFFFHKLRSDVTYKKKSSFKSQKPKHFVPASLTLNFLPVVVFNVSRLTSANVFGCLRGTAVVVTKNAESVQKPLNQELYSRRLAAAEDFETDLASQWKPMSGWST